MEVILIVTVVAVIMAIGIYDYSKKKNKGEN